MSSSPIPALTHSSAPPPTWRIQLGLIDPNPHQPRHEIDEPALAELIASIGDHGLLQPVTVRRIAGGRYQLIAGHRRLEAFKRLLAAPAADARERFGTIPAHEKFDVTDEEMALFALIENLQRDDLSPLDAALGLAKFQEAHQLSTDGLSKRTGLELDRVKRLLRLARTPKVIQDACHMGLMVEATLGGATTTKRERVRLELMAALEFAKVHAHACKTTPKKADERTGKAIERALSERWSFRRIQAFCRAALAGTAIHETGPGDAAQGNVPAPIALFTDGPELRIRREQLRTAPSEERLALLELLKGLIGELAA
jgi:ParB/RepB/Spo0J family partition protein